MALIDHESGLRWDIPHEPGAWMRLRPLTWLETAAADAEGARRAMQSAVKSLDGASKEFLATITPAQADAAERQARRQREQQPYTQRLDQRVTLEAGIVGWSYADEVTPASVARLDPQTARAAFLEIVRLSTIGADEGEASAPRLNGSTAGTAPTPTVGATSISPVTSA